MSNTQKNLEEAFAGESQASRRYLYFAEKADSEGLPQIARLFRAASESETVHARNHLKAMGGIGSSQDNLKASAEGESYEFNQMYPGFIEQARAENNQKAEISFDYANKVEKIHHGFITRRWNCSRRGRRPGPSLTSSARSAAIPWPVKPRRSARSAARPGASLRRWSSLPLSLSQPPLNYLFLVVAGGYLPVELGLMEQVQHLLYLGAGGNAHFN